MHGAGACTLTGMASTPSTPRAQGGGLQSPFTPRPQGAGGACTLTGMASTPSTPRSQGAGGQQSPSTPRPQGAGGLERPSTVDFSGLCHDFFNSPRAVQPPSAALSRHITLDALQTVYRAQQQHLAAATQAGTLNVKGKRPDHLRQHIVDGLAAAQKLLGQDNTAHHTRGGGIMEGPRPDTEGGKVCSRVCVDSTDACMQRRPCSRAHMPVRVLAVARARACPCNLCLRGAHVARRMSGHVPALGPMSPC
jgi:hypothetical protein